MRTLIFVTLIFASMPLIFPPLVVGQTTQHAFLWTPSGGMQDLGSLGGSSYAYGISSSGEVVGYYIGFSGQLRAFLWTSKAGMQDLGSLGGGSSVAFSINSTGRVVGWSTTTTGYAHAFMWTQSQGMRDLGTLGGNYSEATDINDNGQIVGASTLPGDTINHAFIKSLSGNMHDLGTLAGGSSSYAEGINSKNIVVGNALTTNQPTPDHAVRWIPKKSIQDLGTLGGVHSNALKINSSGSIVGFSYLAGGGGPHAFLWSEASGMQDLGTLLGCCSGTSDALGLNDQGQIVGYSSLDNFNSVFHAVLWTDPTHLLDLGTLGGTNSTALRISATGSIVGYSDIP